MNKKRQRITYETKRDILQITKKLNYPSVEILNPALKDKLGLYIKKTFYFNLKQDEQKTNDLTPTQLQRTPDSKLSIHDNYVEKFLVSSEMKSFHFHMK